MSPLVPSVVLVGLGIYLLVTALPWGAPRASLAERLRRFDVDADAAAQRAWGRRGGRGRAGRRWSPCCGPC